MTSNNNDNGFVYFWKIAIDHVNSDGNARIFTIFQTTTNVPPTHPPIIDTRYLYTTFQLINFEMIIIDNNYYHPFDFQIQQLAMHAFGLWFSATIGLPIKIYFVYWIVTNYWANSLANECWISCCEPMLLNTNHLGYLLRIITYMLLYCCIKIDPVSPWDAYQIH